MNRRHRIDRSCLEAFINKMEELLGEQYSGFIESYNERANQGLTVNTLKIDIKIFLSMAPFDLTPVPVVKRWILLWIPGPAGKTSIL